VLLAFFVLAVQLFVTLIEFKLATLAGFVLIPFGLFGKTAFMAERVLGHVVSSGIKVLVLAVIIGIGSTLFSEFTAGFGDTSPTIDDAMSIVLAALSLLGLGIFGPGIANGLVSGGPQLGAGAAVGAGLAAGGVVAAGAAGVAMGGAALGQGAAAAARGGSTMIGAASTAYSLGSMGRSGVDGVRSGVAAVGRAGVGAATSPLRRAVSRAGESMQANAATGARSAFAATGGSSSAGTVGAEPANAAAVGRGADKVPTWARHMRHAQTLRHGLGATTHAVRSAESHGSGSSITLSESEH
jgi:type IV secretion system protein TrbL